MLIVALGQGFDFNLVCSQIPDENQVLLSHEMIDDSKLMVCMRKKSKLVEDRLPRKFCSNSFQPSKRVSIQKSRSKTK